MKKTILATALVLAGFASNAHASLVYECTDGYNALKIYRNGSGLLKSTFRTIAGEQRADCIDASFGFHCKSGKFVMNAVHGRGGQPVVHVESNGSFGVERPTSNSFLYSILCK